MPEFIIDKTRMLSHQRQWWELENFIKALVGGFGSGKTWIGGLRALYLSYLNKGIPGQYVSPSYRLAFKSVIPVLIELMDGAGLRYLFNQSRMAFFIKNWGGVIWLGSAEDPESLRGPSLAWMGIDEPFLCSKAVLDQALARVRHPQATHREIFLTGTPEELNWGHDLAMNDEGKYDVGLVIASTRDNHHLPGEYVDTLLAAYSPEQVQAYIDGKFVNLASGRVYKPFDRDKHVIARPDLRDKNLPIVAGIDFNVDFMTAVVAYKPHWGFHVFDEIRLANANTDELAEVLSAKYPGIEVYPDPTGKARKSSSTASDHEILRRAGFTVRSRDGSPPVRDRVNAVNRLLREKRLTMEGCPWLIKDLERNQWRSGDVDKRNPELTHAADAAGYLVEYCFPLISRGEFFIGER